jgi:hypothetical protein
MGSQLSGEFSALSLSSQDSQLNTGDAERARDSLQYLPLGDLEIRILRILPALESDEIQCNLTHVECDSNYRCPYPYRALSYCWGDANDTLLITVNGSKLAVTKNLEAALRELRGRKVVDIWIDAICINQQDQNERGHQILKMRGIYQHAFETFVWLGQETEHTKDAFSLLEVLGAGIPETEFQAKTQELRARHSENLKGLGWIAVAYFMGLPYWQRTWIIQEVALSQRPTILWGQETMAIETLSNAMVTIKECKLDHSGFFEGYADIRGVLHLWRRTEGNPKVSMLDLQSTLSWSCPSIASEQRDKVFGLLGLSLDGEYLIPSPDYREPIDSILRRITLKRLANGSEGILDIICLDVPEVPRKIEFPSWVVNWVAFWESASVSRCSCRSRLLNSTDVGTSTYKACGNSDPFVRFSSDELILICRGYLFDTIQRVCKKHPKVHILGDDRCEITPAQSYDKSIHVNVYGSKADLHEAIWRSIVQDRMRYRSKKAPTSFGQQFRTLFPDDPSELQLIWTDSMAQYLCTSGDFEIYGKNVKTWSRMGYDTTRQKAPGSGKPLDPATKEFWDAVNLGIHSRRMMETSKGYVGMTHAQSQAGDVITLLQGASVPIILRPCDGGYKVIGESYVHGIMDGEYWNAQDEASMVEFHIK